MRSFEFMSEVNVPEANTRANYRFVLALLSVASTVIIVAAQLESYKNTNFLLGLFTALNCLPYFCCSGKNLTTSSEWWKNEQAKIDNSEQKYRAFSGSFFLVQVALIVIIAANGSNPTMLSIPCMHSGINAWMAYSYLQKREIQKEEIQEEGVGLDSAPLNRTTR